MCFNRWQIAHSICAVAAAVWILSGCSLETGDKAPDDTSLRLKSSKYSCLANIDDEIKKYFDGSLNDAQVKNFFSCLKNALNTFEVHTRGKELSGYAPMEIANFLNDKFLYKSKLLEPLVDEIMSVKTLMVGGRENFITRSEFEYLVNFLDVVQEEAVKNLPYVRLYRIKIDMSPLDRVDPILLRSAKVQLASTAKRLSEYLSKSGNTYSMDSFERFIEEGRKFVNWEAFNTSSIAPADLRELMSRFKEITVGRDRQLIRANEWESFLKSVVSTYSAYLDFEYLVGGKNMLYGEDLENFIELAKDVIQLAQDSINRQPQKVIAFSGINGMIDILDKIKLLPLNIQGSSLKPTLQYAIQYVLKDPDSIIDPKKVTGLNFSNLNEARKEFDDWAESQRVLNRIAQDELKRQGRTTFDPYVPFFSSLLKEFDFADPKIVPRSKYNNKNIEFLVDHVHPMFRIDSNRVWIVPEEERKEAGILHGIHDLGRLNVIRAVVRQLIRGFAQGKDGKSMDRARIMMMSTDPSKTGVTAQEMEKFYQTARHLGEDLLFMDPRKDQVGLRIFREGNIFTFAGNGIQEPDSNNRHLLAFNETVEVISFMWSGGQVRDSMHGKISKICEAETRRRPELDILKTVKIDRDCFFKHMGDESFAVIDNLPYMQIYLEKLRDFDRQKFYGALEDLGKIQNQKGAGACFDYDHIELAELATMATVLHYVESIFTMYDRNRDGFLNANEVMSAFPRFRGFLSEAVQKETGSIEDVDTLKAIFVFLVKERRFPEGIGNTSGLLWNAFGFSDDPNVVDTNLPSMQVDRSGILDILVMLNGVTSHSLGAPRVESLFKMFDRNKDNFLNETELMTAFSRIHPFFKKALEDIENADVKPGGDRQKLSADHLKAKFLFLVQNSRLPRTMYERRVSASSIGFSKNINEIDDDLPALRVDRYHLRAVLDYLEKEVPRVNPKTHLIPVCTGH